MPGLQAPETDTNGQHKLLQTKTLSAKATAGATLPPIYDSRQPEMSHTLFDSDETEINPITINCGDVIDFNVGGRDETLLIVQITGCKMIGYDVTGTGYQDYTCKQIESLIQHNLTDMVDGEPRIYPDPFDYGTQTTS